MSTSQVFEPLKEYNQKYKDLHEQNTINFFNDLVKESKLDINLNKNTIKKYNSTLTKMQKSQKFISRLKLFRLLILILSIISILIGIYFLLSFKNIGFVAIVIGLLLVVLAIILLIIPFKKLGNKISDLKGEENKFQQEASNLKQEAYRQMQPLNELYDWNIASHLVQKTVPIIQMDEFFDTKKFEYLNEKYQFMDNDDDTCSTNLIKSGSIMGNPFLIIKTFNQTMVDYTYQNSIVITWTERVSNAKGGTRLVTRSQTLVATISKPRPAYFYDTVLVYGNDAAPKLSFYRGPSGTKGKNEKAIDKMVKDGWKDLEKKSEKAIKTGTNFMVMGNEEFDVLFGAIDRDNEVEFRLLFTPLAQKNMVNLIKSQVPFGDDFKFKKIKNLNYIMSAHSQQFNYRDEPSMFYNFDYEAARKYFIEYNNNYFKSLYFDLAPLLSIPLYQQTKPKEFIYKNTIQSNFPSYEHEAIANHFKNHNFKPDGAVTDQILKTKFIEKDGSLDKVIVRSHAFTATKQVEVVMKMGGDGRMHAIPVTWYLYEPVFKDTEMEMSAVDMTRKDFNNVSSLEPFKKYLEELKTSDIIYERGIVSIIPENEMGKDDIETLKKIMEKDGK